MLHPALQRALVEPVGLRAAGELPGRHDAAEYHQPEAGDERSDRQAPPRFVRQSRVGCGHASQPNAIAESPTTSSTFIAEPHIKIGLVLGDGIAAIWLLLMTMLKAKELIYTGKRIGAQDVVPCDRANRVVEHEQLLAGARARVAR